MNPLDFPRLSNPAFILAPQRSGSTLLRCLLNSHSQIYAPHDLHVMRISVVLEDEAIANSLIHNDLCTEALEWRLRDRLYSDLLERSGKQILVDKSGGNLNHFRALADAWPDSRFIFLWRSPADIQRSIEKTFGWDATRASVNTARKMEALSQAAYELIPQRSCHVSYEALVEDPSKALGNVCQSLGVNFEPEMLHYDTSDLVPIDRGVGDYGERILSGRVQAIQ